MILPIKTMDFQKKFAERKTEDFHIINAFGGKFQIHSFIKIFNFCSHGTAQLKIRAVDDLVRIERFIQHDISKFQENRHMDIDAADKFRKKTKIVDNQMFRITCISRIKTVWCPGIDDVELSLGDRIGGAIVNVIALSIIYVNNLTKIMGMYF